MKAVWPTNRTWNSSTINGPRASRIYGPCRRGWRRSSRRGIEWHQSMDRFQNLLCAYLYKLADLRQRGASEDSIRDAFLGLLRAAFPRLEQAEPILLEQHISGIRLRG